VNVKKWEDTVAEDERELEKLKKDENKQMKVCAGCVQIPETRRKSWSLKLKFCRPEKT